MSDETPGPQLAVEDRTASAGTARTAAFIAVAEIIGKVATLAYTLVAARALSPEAFGAFSYALAYAALLQTLPALGFDAVLIRQASTQPTHLPARLAENLTWRAGLGVPVFVVGALLALPSRPDAPARIALLVVLAAALLDLHDQTWRAAAAARQRQVAMFAALIVQRLVSAALAVGVLVAGGGLVELAVAYLVGSVAGTAMLLVVARRIGVRADFRAVAWSGLAGAGRASAVIGVYAIVSTALFRLDAVLLEAFTGDRTVAVYATAYRLVETVLFVAWAISRATFPVMAADPSPAPVRKGFTQGLSAAAIVYLPFAVVALVAAPEVLHLLFGDPYGELAAPALRWLAFAPLGFAVGYLGGRALVALTLERRTLVAALVATVVNVGLNVALIPRFEEVAAAFATTLSYALQGALMLAILRRRVGRLGVPRALAEPTAGSGAMALVMLVAPLPLLLDVALGGLAFGVVWYALARRWSPEQVRLLGALVPGRPRRA